MTDNVGAADLLTVLRHVDRRPFLRPLLSARGAVRGVGRLICAAYARGQLGVQVLLSLGPRHLINAHQLLNALRAVVCLSCSGDIGVKAWL